MIRLQIVSDLHVEFQHDRGAWLLDEIAKSNRAAKADALIVAGDLAPAKGGLLETALRRLADSVELVLFVAGNHEYYGSCPRDLTRVRDKLSKLLNLDWLERSHTFIGDTRIHGATLWFPDGHGLVGRDCLNDFVAIRNFDPWVYEECRKAAGYLEREVRPGDVVITHHLPSKKCVSERFKDSVLNAFFVCDVEPMLRKTAPSLWIHGHTHDSKDFRIGKTRVVCNPFGYARYEENQPFRTDLVVEVGK